jgi:MFS family permease
MDVPHSDPAKRPLPHGELEPPDLERPASLAPTEAQLEHETPGGRDAGGHDPYAALRLRDYRLYSLGWMVSVIGRQVQDVAVGYELYQRTGSKLALGWVGLAQAIPLLLLALPAGQLADRFDRRRILIVSQLLWVLSSAGLALVSHLHGPVPLVYVLLVTGAVAHAAGWPARSSMLPQIVPPHLFSNAVTWNSSIFQVASVAGPAVAGLVLLWGATACYLIDVACGVAFALLLWQLRLSRVERPREPATLRSLTEGVRFVWRAPVILATLSLDLFAVLLGGATILMPVFAQDVLQVGKVGLGMLRTAPAVGAFAAAILIAHLPPMRRAGRAMLWAVAGFGAATVVFGLSTSFWLSLLMLALTGAFDNVSVVVRHTLVQTLPPDAMRGRVAAVNIIFIGTSNELGAFESGLTAEWWGPVAAVVVGGIGTMVVVALVALLAPQVRQLGSLRDVRAWTPTSRSRLSTSPRAGRKSANAQAAVARERSGPQPFARNATSTTTGR